MERKKEKKAKGEGNEQEQSDEKRWKLEGVKYQQLQKEGKKVE